MKTLKTSLLIAALVFSSVLSAAPVKKDKSTTLTEEIGTLLQNPNFEINEDITASVNIILNEEHEIVVLSVEAPNSKIEGFIKNRLNYKQVETFTQNEGELINVPVRFTSKK
ncbi:MAG: hypothetical protein KJN82_00885 [Bacteroidia bacterium]|nr:hypothetical protein [Bacteroidia bacterium]